MSKKSTIESSQHRGGTDESGTDLCPGPGAQAARPGKLPIPAMLQETFCVIDDPALAAEKTFPSAGWSKAGAGRRNARPRPPGAAHAARGKARHGASGRRQAARQPG